jgi:hypothetical protein
MHCCFTSIKYSSTGSLNILIDYEMIVYLLAVCTIVLVFSERAYGLQLQTQKSQQKLSWTTLQMSQRSSISIGTRGSPLALAQAHETRNLLAKLFPELAAPDAVKIVPLMTTVRGFNWTVRCLPRLMCVSVLFY